MENTEDPFPEGNVRGPYSRDSLNEIYKIVKESQERSYGVFSPYRCVDCNDDIPSNLVVDHSAVADVASGLNRESSDGLIRFEEVLEVIDYALRTDTDVYVPRHTWDVVQEVTRDKEYTDEFMKLLEKETETWSKETASKVLEVEDREGKSIDVWDKNDEDLEIALVARALEGETAILTYDSDFRELHELVDFGDAMNPRHLYEQLYRKEASRKT
ncbi:MAG: hypothetical protein ABEJ95_02485 [Candidatus Nanohalobium sp.]